MQIITKTRTKTKTEIGQMLQKDSCRGNVETIKPFEDKDKKKSNWVRCHWNVSIYVYILLLL